MFERRLRLGSGLVLAAYVIPHLANHGVALVSLEAAEAVRRASALLWRNPAGGVVLYGAFLAHLALGLLALYRRPRLRMPAAEAAQLALGLLVWPLLLGHAIGTRLAFEVLGIRNTYDYVVAAIWFGGGWMIAKQMALVVVVWGHLALGLHFRLRVKPGYRAAFPYRLALAALLPLLALAGFAQAGLAVEEIAALPGGRRRLFAPSAGASAEGIALVKGFEPALLAVFAGLVALVLVARAARAWRR